MRKRITSNYVMQTLDSQTDDSFQWQPSENMTFRIRFRNSYIWVTCDSQYAKTYEEITRSWVTLECFGKGKAFLESFLLEAKEEFEEKTNDKTEIWFAGDNNAVRRGFWNKVCYRPSRPLHTVILPRSVEETLISDMQVFLDSEDWYFNRGIPYRRGYLLYGPPGTGKTSFVTAAAGALNLIICIINLSSEAMSDESLNLLLSSAPYGSIVLFEDIDAAFTTSVPNDPQSDTNDYRNREHSRLTFSGLLNALDGVAAQEGKMIFLTTNHIEKLDPALLRPGRIDIQLKFGLSPQDLILRLFLRFYEGITLSDPSALQQFALSFSNSIPEKQYSMAEIQGYLMRYRTSPQQAVENIHHLINRNEFESRHCDEAQLLNPVDFEFEKL
jgi:mitochondrial chaperone BCS1